MSMEKLVKLFTLCAAFVASMLGSSAAYAQSATSCGLSGSAVAAGTLQYDPFSPSGLTNVTIPLTLTRFTGPGGKKTQQVYFILEKPVGSPNYQVIFQNPNTGTSTNVVYNVGGHPGLPIANQNALGQIYYNFLGASAPDVVTFNVLVTVPAGTDLSAGGNISFDIIYLCNGTGGLDDVLTPALLPQAISINVNVLSALQASYAGGILDFGEVGNVTTTNVLAAPATYTRSGNVNVRSSGPYSVSMNSDNNYKLTFSGGTLTNPAQTLTYSATFVGLSRTGVSGNNAAIAPITKTCNRAGLGGVSLPVSVTLKEGGQGGSPAKIPASLYNDFLNVTISPLAANTPGSAC
jgi:hypothetical protein